MEQRGLVGASNGVSVPIVGAYNQVAENLGGIAPEHSSHI